MSLAYNAMLRSAHGRAGLRPPDYPARSLGITPWVREGPVGGTPRPQVPSQRVNILQVLEAQAESSSYEGVAGRGSLVPVAPADTEGAESWYGPGVM